MKKLILLILILSPALLCQWGGWGQPAKKVDVVEDSTALKSLDANRDRLIFVKHYTSSSRIGGGLFFSVDSLDGHPNSIYTFPSATAGRHWRRWETLNDSTTVYADWSGIRGDFSGARADTAARGNDTAKLTKMINAGTTIICPNNASYWVSKDGLDFSGKNIVALGGLTVYASDTRDNGAIYAKGSIDGTQIAVTANVGGHYDDKDNDIFNELTVASTSTFAADDIIFLSSDSTRGSVEIGELCQVDSIISSTKILLKMSVHSFYNTAKNPTIQKVNHTTFSSVGKVTVKYLAESAGTHGTVSTEAIGFYFEYVDKLNVRDLYSYDFIAKGFIIAHCYRPVMTDCVTDQNLAGGLGYGFNIVGSTTEGRFSNLFSGGARHAVSFGAGSGQGISFGCVVSNSTFHGRATFSGGTWIVDAHVECGDFTIIGCKLRYYGAAIYTSGAPIAGGGTGFNLGANRNTIKECVVEGVEEGISMRAPVSTVCVEELRIVDGVGSVYAGGAFTTDSLILRGVKAPNMTLFYVAVSNVGVNYLEIDDGVCYRAIDINGDGKTGITLPSTITLKNIKCESPYSIALDNYDVTPDTFAVRVGTWNNLSVLNIQDCSFNNYTEAIYINASDITRVVVDNCTFQANRTPVRLSGGACSKVVFKDNTFLEQYTGTSNLGVLSYDAVGTALDSLCFMGNLFDGPRMVFFSGSNPGAVDFFWGDNVVSTSNFISRFHNTAAVTNQFGADYKDDTYLKFGDSDDFTVHYSAAATELKIRDAAANDLLQISDNGSDADFEFTGKIGIGKAPSAILDIQDNSAHVNTAYLEAYQINDAAAIMSISFNSGANTLAKGSLSGTADGGIVILNRDATGTGDYIDFRGDNVSQMRLNSGGGLTVGSPAGGSQGAGTSNVEGAYADKFQLNALNTAPSSAIDTGTTGEIRIDANYIYICVATNTWKRVAIATW